MKTYYDNEYLRITRHGTNFTIQETCTEQGITLIEEDIPHIIAALTAIQNDIQRDRNIARDRAALVLMGAKVS
jgi:GTPase Era involved in 16S rRNA processing